MSVSVSVSTAYARCEEITRTEARNFAYGIRLLPRPKRQAMSAVYALARRIDDIGDGPESAEVKLEHLATVRADVHTLAGRGFPGDDPVMVALADATTRFAIPLDAFEDLVAGCERDATGGQYASFDELVSYCRLVAGSIGRLSLGVFGSTDPPRASELADDLGVALQLTNILRDVVEDREMGRVYLPAEDLQRFGCAPDLGGPDLGGPDLGGPDLGGPGHALSDLVAFEAERARAWFARGLGLLDLLDRRSRACVAAMAGIYRRVLARIEADPASVLERRVSLPTWEKAWVAARSLAGARA